jgi:hypothetical protein
MSNVDTKQRNLKQGQQVTISKFDGVAETQAATPPVRYGAETDSEDNKAPSENNRIHGSDHAVHGEQ